MLTMWGLSTKHVSDILVEMWKSLAKNSQFKLTKEKNNNLKVTQIKREFLVILIFIIVNLYNNIPFRVYIIHVFWGSISYLTYQSVKLVTAVTVLKRRSFQVS